MSKPCTCSHFVCPLCGVSTQMIVRAPFWHCPKCAAVLQPTLLPNQTPQPALAALSLGAPEPYLAATADAQDVTE